MIDKDWFDVIMLVYNKRLEEIIQMAFDLCGFRKNKVNAVNVRRVCCFRTSTGLERAVR